MIMVCLSVYSDCPLLAFKIFQYGVSVHVLVDLYYWYLIFIATINGIGFNLSFQFYIVSIYG